MKLASWNVNGIRACGQKGLVDWVEREGPHVLCLQETKAWPEQLDASLTHIDGYSSYFFSGKRKGYSGLALYLHHSLTPQKIVRGLGMECFDCEGRTLALELDDLVIINGYYPNGQRDLNRVPFKLDFSYAMLELALKYVGQKKKVILCGDFNTAHHPIDLANPKQNKKTTGFLPEERAFLDELEHQQFVDTFRHFHPDEPDHYTWWTYRNNCRQRNIGWRIDYFFVSQSLLPQVLSSEHRPEVLGSDHCPIVLEIERDGDGNGERWRRKRQ